LIFFTLIFQKLILNFFPVQEWECVYNLSSLVLIKFLIFVEYTLSLLFINFQSFTNSFSRTNQVLSSIKIILLCHIIKE
jgi:hypothetical protein